MSQRLISKTVISFCGLFAFGFLAGCSGAGEGVGNQVLPQTLINEGGTDEAVESTLPGQYLAGRQALREKDIDAAYRFFDRAYSYDSEDDYLLRNTFSTALANGDATVTVDLAKKMLERDVKNRDLAHLVLAVENIRLQNFPKALEQVNEVRASGFNILLKPVLTAWIHVGLNNFEAARKSLDALDKYDGFKLLKSYHLALLAHAAGQEKLASEQYEAALKGPSGRAVRLVQSYGSFLVEQGRKEEARKLFEDYKKSYPLSPTIHRLIADISNGHEIKPLIGGPVQGAAEALYSSASLIGQEQANGTAIIFAQFSLMLRPDLTVSHILLAEIAEDRKNIAKARDYYSLVPPESPYYLNSKIRIAWLTYKLGDDTAAVTTLDKLIAENPTEVEPYVVLADLNRDRKNWEAAAKAYGQAIDNLGEAKSRLWSLLYARGIAYERMKRWDLAEVDLLAALELKPNHPQILNYIGYSWADRGEKLERAKEMLIKAVSLRPRDGYIVDSLGWLYYRVGDFDNATKQLEKAVSLQPEDPTINDHLGDAYWQVGRYEEARYQWQRALWLDPDEDQIPLIKDKLENGMPADQNK